MLIDDITERSCTGCIVGLKKDCLWYAMRQGSASSSIYQADSTVAR